MKPHEKFRKGNFSEHPKAKYWSKKNEKKPIEVALNCNKKFMFDCPDCLHEFEKSCSSINRGGWCPYCANQKRCGKCDICLKKSFASHGKAKYWSNKNKQKPIEVALNSGKKYIFDCPDCSHEFDASCDSLNGKGRWCPYCANQKRCEKCDICLKKSFVSHEKAKFWSNRNKQKPIEVALNSNTKFIFDCPDCLHEFKASCNNINGKRNWCPYCSPANKKKCGNILCEFCKKKSFASHPRAKCWSKKNKKKPYEVGLNSNTKFIFDCPDCLHEFEKSCCKINGPGRWCPYCANQKRCEKCDICLKKSFASHPRAKCWSNKNEQKPIEVALNSGKKYIFDCPDCNQEYISTCNHISGGRTWCNCKKNKTEAKLKKWFSTHPLIKKVIHLWRPTWCSTEFHEIKREKSNIGRFQYEYDFLVTLQNEKLLIIELDGRQHKVDVPFFKTTALENQIRDKYKEKKARENNINIIRICQEDVWFDKNNWEDNLNKQLTK